MKTYQVIVRPGEKYWILEIPGIGFTQARTTAEIESMARDLITVMTQDADFALTVETKLPQSVQEHLDEARRLRKEEAECDRTQRGKLAPQHKNYMAWVSPYSK